jgi:hypothetical protein
LDGEAIVNADVSIVADKFDIERLTVESWPGRPPAFQKRFYGGLGGVNRRQTGGEAEGSEFHIPLR